jgi:hypothetical protein
MTGASAPAAAKPELVGIGGWLILVAIGQVLGPIGTLVSIGNYYLHEVDTPMFDILPLIVYGTIALSAAYLAYSVFTTIMFFRHSRLFPRLYILQWILMAAMPLVDVAWVAITASVYTGESLTDFLTIDVEHVGQVVAALILGPIWIAYMLRSRRVANTFVK